MAKLEWLFYSFDIFITSTLADGFSQRFKQQKVFSSLQDSSLYPSQSEQCRIMISFRPIISKSISHTNTLVTRPRAPITTGITINKMFNTFFFSYLARSSFFSPISISLHFILGSVVR